MASKSKGTALVTGGAIRIGKAISIALAKAGYDIALHYNTSELEAEKTAGEIKKIGQNCIIFQSDLNSYVGVEELLYDVFESFDDKVDLLVNNASIFEEYNFKKTDEDIFNRHMNINFKAPFFLTQGFSERVKKGHIVNILDSNITLNATRRIAYILSKKMLYEFTRMSAKELGPKIKVNGIAIGTTEISSEDTKGYLANKKKTLPLKKIVTLDEVTDALVGLVESKGLTGQCIFVDGGEQLI